MYWGFSEALDLCSEYMKHVNPDPGELNILLFGSCDPRHILLTLAKSYRHNVKLNFFVVDGVIEIVARNIMLLAIALEDPENMSLKSKTHLFMDVYGNTLLRPFSYNYLVSKAETLRKLITDQEKLELIAPMLNIDNIKYRERDGLEEAFNFLLPREGHIFKINEYWEGRLRKMLGTRYDHRMGAFDWDLQMKLKGNEAKQICPQEYKHWRDTGIAFLFPEYEYSQPNKTLVSGLVRNGNKYLHRGYVGDVEIGPYCTFGLNTKQEKMSESFHGTNFYRSTDVTERNLFEILYEIQEKTEYVHDEKNSHKYGAAILDTGKNLPSCAESNMDLKDYDKSFIATPNLKVYLLSLDDILSMQEGNRLKKAFDIVFVASNYFAFLKEGFFNVFRNQALVLFETKLYSLWKKEDLNDFLEKIKAYAKGVNLKNITNFNINLNYSVVKFKHNYPE